MSTLLQPPLNERQSDSPCTSTAAAAQRLRATTAAVRLSFTWFGTRKTLSSDQKAQAAAAFGADDEVLSASKRLIDVKHPAFKAVSAVKSQATGYWKSISLPFPEPGIRLIRQTQVEAFDQQLQEFREDLDEAVAKLNRHFGELRQAAARRLGSLYDAADYPASLDGLFQIDWTYPSVEPPPYLQRLAPELYQQECQRAQARFDEAVQLAEAAFTEELHRLVAHLTERLSGQADGKRMIFRDSAVGNLTEFFERFRSLNIRSNDQLDELVGQCRQIVVGVEPQTLRDNQVLRTSVAAELAEVQNVLDGLLVDRPRRNILRRPR